MAEKMFSIFPKSHFHVSVISQSCIILQGYLDSISRSFVIRLPLYRAGFLNSIFIIPLSSFNIVLFCNSTFQMPTSLLMILFNIHISNAEATCSQNCRRVATYCFMFPCNIGSCHYSFCFGYYPSVYCYLYSHCQPKFIRLPR